MVRKDFFEAEVLGHPFVFNFVKPNQVTLQRARERENERKRERERENRREQERAG